MFNRVKVTTAAALIAVTGFSGQLQAADSGLEMLIDGAVKHAVFATAQELNFEVLTAVANLTHHITLDEENYKTQVLISNVDNADTTATRSNQSAE